MPVCILFSHSLSPANWFNVCFFQLHQLASLPQNIIITISAIEDPPVVSSENIYIDEDSTAILLFKASDGDGTESLNITILSLPQNGILLVQSSTQPDAENITITNVPFTLPSNISFAYFIPTSDENGMPYASVSYKANDGLMDSLNNGTITIYVKPVNGKIISRSINSQCLSDVIPVKDAPSFQRSSLNLTVYEDTPSVFRFNISDVDKEDSLSIRISELQLQGDLYVVSSIEDFQDIGQFKKTAPLGEGSEIRKQPFQLLYIPRPNFYTFDSFTIQRFVLTFTDGKMSVSEEVSFPVLPVNDPPRLHCDTPLIELPTQFTTTSGSSHEINLSVTDVDDINFTFNLIKAPQVGFLFQLTNSTVVRPITAGDSFQAWTLLYNSNFSGGGNPFGNFTLTVYDSRGLKSEPCTYIFSFTCPSGWNISCINRPPLVYN
ncbi:hypothetical protein BKA69DRAFT_687368 [Paraphysoderma sedebokerense]|nr:hypothetical protein BKA69DRAFT_687368 [Paraphysoderma sedebokerense]